jgi:hypothetical protein
MRYELFAATSNFDAPKKVGEAWYHSIKSAQQDAMTLQYGAFGIYQYDSKRLLMKGYRNIKSIQWVDYRHWKLPMVWWYAAGATALIAAVLGLYLFWSKIPH